MNNLADDGANDQGHGQDVRAGERFEFGRNWTLFLQHLSEERIALAEESLRKMLEVRDLVGRSFLDIGSGSGLFSLAARRMGARVHSFDYDPQSVACTRELRSRFFPDDGQWDVESGSVLDLQYLAGLGKYDVVYSWGVLHHTGQMWSALDNAGQLVASDGQLFVAIYNDQGAASVRWHRIKKAYNRLPGWLRSPYALAVMAPSEAKEIVRYLLAGKPGEYIDLWRKVDPRRGMNRWRDIIDWVGGYPFEVAAPEQIFDFYRERGFGLTKLRCGGVGSGCNEFVFQRIS